MTLLEVKTAPAPPTSERSLALNFFQAQLERVKSGRIKRYDLMTLNRDWEGNMHLYTPAQRIIGGVKLFSDSEIKAGVQQILNELTGETDGWDVVEGITHDQPDRRDKSNLYYDVLSWKISTIQDGVLIGVDKAVDDRCTWSKTVYLEHNKPEKSSRKEKIPWFVKQAAKLVPVGDYLQLRFNYSGLVEGLKESVAITCAAGAISKDDLSYILSNPLPLPVNPIVLLAREELINVPLETYLAARKQHLEAVKEEANYACVLCEDEEYPTEEVKSNLEYWSTIEAKSKAELAVIDKVAEAGKIKIDA